MFPLLFGQTIQVDPSENSLVTAIGRNLVPITAISLGILWLIIYSIVESWRKVRVAEQNAVLKKDMIERGFSADEIVRVIRTGAPSNKIQANNKGSSDNSA